MGALQPIQRRHLGDRVSKFTISVLLRRPRIEVSPLSLCDSPVRPVRPQFLGCELNSWQMLWMILGTNL